MDKITKVREWVKELAIKFGADESSFIERNNTNDDSLKDNGAFFGLISPDEPKTGPYCDFSLVVMPSNDEKPWVICIGVGSSGFRNDYDLANYPGVRRLFSKLINDQGYCKLDFSDIDTPLPKGFLTNQQIGHLKNTLKVYSKVMPVVQVLDDPENNEGKKLITAFVAAYAKIRNWPSNKNQRDAVFNALLPFNSSEIIEDESEIQKLLLERKYVVLQGPPGTGKTRTAKEIAKKLNALCYLTQFHAETSYSDFIYGIRPALSAENLKYEKLDGIFSKALKEARSKPEEKVILIIDEINRANLSNVLGPIFYLFEYKANTSGVEIEISPDLRISEIPKNLYVIATMNTADRSLAVIDFALRRRFAWYTLNPKQINSGLSEGEIFCLNDYLRFKEIFEYYASSKELIMQPGQGYFIAKDDNEMKNRIKYELLPLIKEYLSEGMLTNAKEEFNEYFKSRIQTGLVD